MKEIFDADLKKRISGRLAGARMRLLFQNPFYGNLVLHLKFTLAKCGTAGTDMVKIYFDPEFVDRLSDEELDFLLMHEILHCALRHPARRKNRNHQLYNIACDIVVNSNIMQSKKVSAYFVDGEEVMHLTPTGEEGYQYSADEVYDMLWKMYESEADDQQNGIQQMQGQYGEGMDTHGNWEKAEKDIFLETVWQENVKDAAGRMGRGGQEIPAAIREMLVDWSRAGKVNWREILREFISTSCDHYDYSFLPPDRRFSNGDFFLPSFVETTDENIENLWFLIDTSGSISRQSLSDAFREVGAAIEQFDYLSGILSFFDTHVTEPVPFDSVEELQKITPEGGGGTSFSIIFHYMKEHMMEKLPTAIVIMTDGCAVYPPEEVTLDVPVLWLIQEGGEKAPWGTTVFFETKE